MNHTTQNTTEVATPKIDDPVIQKRLIAHAVRNIPAAKKHVERLFQKPTSRVSVFTDANARNKYYNSPKFNFS